MPQFRAAYTEDMLAEVKTYKYDKYFNNWINPKVLKKFTSKSAKKNKKIWKKSYGLKHSGQMKEYGKHGTAKYPTNKSWKKICHNSVSVLSL